MRILAIDTSSKNCSVAIVEFSNDSDCTTIAIENSNDEKTHSQKLMPIIDKIFKSTNLSIKDMDYIACCIGPGSFTGIRIGIATAKAFGDSQNIPLIGINSLESLAHNVDTNEYTFSIIDAKNENIYCSIIKNFDFYLKPTALNINDLQNINLPDTDSSIVFVGDGSITYKEQLQNIFKNRTISFSDNNIQSAISLAKCAYNKYLNGDYGDSSTIFPLYLRKSQAERIADGEQK